MRNRRGKQSSDASDPPTIARISSSERCRRVRSESLLAGANPPVLGAKQPAGNVALGRRAIPFLELVPRATYRPPKAPLRVQATSRAATRHLSRSVQAQTCRRLASCRQRRTGDGRTAGVRYPRFLSCPCASRVTRKNGTDTGLSSISGLRKSCLLLAVLVSLEPSGVRRALGKGVIATTDHGLLGVPVLTD